MCYPVCCLSEAGNISDTKNGLKITKGEMGAREKTKPASELVTQKPETFFQKKKKKIQGVSCLGKSVTQVIGKLSGDFILGLQTAV